MNNIYYRFYVRQCISIILIILILFSMVGCAPYFIRKSKKNQTEVWRSTPPFKVKDKQ